MLRQARHVATALLFATLLTGSSCPKDEDTTEVTVTSSSGSAALLETLIDPSALQYEFSNLSSVAGDAAPT